MLERECREMVSVLLQRWMAGRAGREAKTLASDGGNMGGVRVLWSLSQGQPPLDSEHC